MVAFVVFNTAESGQIKTVLRYGECPAEDVADQANENQTALPVHPNEMAAFATISGLIEEAPFDGGSTTTIQMTIDIWTGVMGYRSVSTSVTAREINTQRRQLLADSDWTQLADAPLTTAKKSEWASYRQALRDIPGQPGFPGSVTWPVQPT